MAKRLLPLLVLAIALVAPTTAAAEFEHRRDFVEDAMVTGANGDEYLSGVAGPNLHSREVRTPV